MAEKKKVAVEVVGEVVDGSDGKAQEASPEAKANAVKSEFLQTNQDQNKEHAPAGADDNLEFLQTDGSGLSNPAPSTGKATKKPKVGDEVFYCTGYRDTGEKDEDGNRVMVEDYAPATIYQVDDENAKSGHVLLVYSGPVGQKIPAWAHNDDANPGYWTAKKPEPKAG